MQLDIIQQRIESVWELLKQEPTLATKQAENILQEIRAFVHKSTAQSRSAFIMLELRALHLLGHSYFIINELVKSRDTANTLFHLANQEESFEYAALSEQILAKIEIAETKYESAKNRLNAILPILKNAENHFYVQAILIDLSHIALYENKYNESIAYLLEAEKEYQEHPVRPRVAMVIMSCMINVYSRVGNFEKASEYALKSVSEFKAMNDLMGYVNGLLQLSNIYSRQGDTAKQIAALQESIEVLIPQNLQYQIAIQRIALGTAFMDMGDFTRAVDEFQQALPILTQEKDRKNIAILHQRMGVLYSHPSFTKRDSNVAQSHFFQAEELALELSMPHFRAAVLECRSESYASFGLFEEAYQMLQRSTTLEKEILNEKTLQQIRELEVRYDIALKEKENELLAAQNRTLALERNHLQTQLTMNNQSILIQMNELNTFRKEVLSITKQLDRAENIVRKVKTKLRESPVMQDSWGSYLETFTKVHPDFQATLLAAYPDLTAMEMKVCILIRAGLQTEEISQILSLSARTIENHRFNLRKKLHVGERENLAKFLMNV